MASPQIIRTAHGGFKDSPFVRLFGQWNGGFVLTAHEAVLFELDASGAGRQAVDLTQMNGLIGAVVKTTGGVDAGTVFQFDNPLFSPAPISPVVRLQPRPNVNYPQLNSGQAIRIADIDFGMQVRLENGTPGRLIDPGDGLGPVGIRPYLGSINPTSVRVAVLEFDTNMAGTEGMPVFAVGGGQDGQLLGMLFNLQSGGGTTFAYCSPATFFK